MAEKPGFLFGTAGVVTKLMGGGVVVLNLSLCLVLSCPSEKTLISSSENKIILLAMICGH